MFQVNVAKQGEELARAEAAQAAAQKESTLATEALKAAKNAMKKTRPDQKEAAKASQKAAEMVNLAKANLKVANKVAEDAVREQRVAGYVLECPYCDLLVPSGFEMVHLANHPGYMAAFLSCAQALRLLGSNGIFGGSLLYQSPGGRRDFKPGARSPKLRLCRVCCEGLSLPLFATTIGCRYHSICSHSGLQ